MKRRHILGLLIGASLAIGFEPVAEAMPAATPGIAAAGVSNAPVVQVVTRAGVVHRSTRRTARRVERRHTY
ncbi:hypothetical protein [Methylocystis iwaonis]|uniref:Uncharacterized protein n=1 Tax=Methylocystis iwaonis TaxID=2885079 RepID=A0ABN6VGS4_9HYPH|nr:hypothetical protein [Methylocystis iwaonis]BDV34540.1 hypothetical protein SS37A_20690 [Methylocystis iwaonis]